jgi:hypothetical protein
MENLIEAIRTALRDDAEPIARRAGLVACRRILATLEGTTETEPVTATSDPVATTSEAPPAPTPNSPPTASPPSPAPSLTTSTAPAPPIDPAMVATLFASLGKLPPEQLLDLAISRLRAALPPDTSVATASPLRFQLVPLGHLKQIKP